MQGSDGVGFRVEKCRRAETHLFEVVSPWYRLQGLGFEVKSF